MLPTWLDTVHVIAGRPCTVKNGGRPWATAMAAVQRELPGAVVFVTDSPGHATALARQSLASGATLVVAAGGDGTISEVVNGLHGGSPTRLGILPLGRGNDYYRTLLATHDLPLKFGLDAAVQRLRHGSSQTLDMGTARYRALDGTDRTQCFTNLVTIGYSAAVARSVTRTRWAGAASYLLCLLSNLLGWRNREGTVTVDDQAHACSVFNLNVALGKYYGTGMVAAPSASLTDGLLDVVLMDDLTVVDVIHYMPANYNGRFDGIAKVKQWRGQHVRVDAPLPILVQIDGEFVGTTPVTIDILPHALEIVF